jgi:two-component system, LuxR family, sensor kinase FixL
MGERKPIKNGHPRARREAATPGDTLKGLAARVRRRTAELRDSNRLLSREVAQRRRAEQTLRAGEALTRAILDTAVDAIATIDTQGRIESFNRAAERMFGYAAADVIGRNVRMLMPEPYSSRHDGYLRNYYRTGKPKIIGIGREVVGLRKDGSTFPLDLAVSEVRLGRRRTFAGIIRDVTERKRLEKEVLETAEREQRRIGADLHDGVCQQLAGINFLLRALQQKLDAGGRPAPGETQQLTTLMSDAINQARGLSHGLNPVDPGANGLQAALGKLADNVRETFRVGCTFRSNRPASAPPLLLLLHDASAAIHLYRIAQEAVNNAVRHGRAKRVAISLNGSPDAVTLAVEDDGVGFPKAAPAGTGVRGGHGMGLRTMRHRAHLIGAEFATGASRRLGGARVTCRLPNAVAPHAVETPPRSYPARPTRRPVHTPPASLVRMPPGRGGHQNAREKSSPT